MDGEEGARGRREEEARLREVYDLGFIDQHEYDLRLRALRGQEPEPQRLVPTTTTTTFAAAAVSTDPPQPKQQQQQKKKKKPTTTTTNKATSFSGEDPGNLLLCKRCQWTVVRVGVAHGANGVISEVEPVGTVKHNQQQVHRAYAKEVRDPGDADQVAYLQKELSILSNKTILANPNIVHLYDWRSQVLVNTTDGVHDSKRVAVPPCIVMEICEKSIKTLMKERSYPYFRSKKITVKADADEPAATRMFGEEEVVKVALDVLNGLQDLHTVLQTYHGDISAKNIMRVRQGNTHRYVLIDFGSSSRFHTHITTPVSLVYAAPEKLDGDWARCDGRCDVFALAVLLSEMLVGKPYRDRGEITWYDVVESEPGRGWSDLLDSELVDWKAFFDGTLCRDAADRLSAAQAAAVLKRRPSARKIRDRARAKDKQRKRSPSPQPLLPYSTYSIPTGTESDT